MSSNVLTVLLEKSNTIQICIFVIFNLLVKYFLCRKCILNSGDLHFLPLPQFAVWSTSREDALRIISVLFFEEEFIALAIDACF